MANQGAQGGRAHLDVATQRIIEHIEQADGLPMKLRTAKTAAAVLCVMSRRMSKGHAQEMTESLPESLGALVQPCVEHHGSHTEMFDRAEFLRLLAEHLKIDENEAEICARAVLRAVHAVLPQGELEHVRNQLPNELWELWGPRRAA
jgi:uncharacterized protein (DUF2267 family)